MICAQTSYLDSIEFAFVPQISFLKFRKIFNHFKELFRVKPISIDNVARYLCLNSIDATARLKYSRYNRWTFIEIADELSPFRRILVWKKKKNYSFRIFIKNASSFNLCKRI